MFDTRRRKRRAFGWPRNRLLAPPDPIDLWNLYRGFLVIIIIGWHHRPRQSVCQTAHHLLSKETYDRCAAHRLKESAHSASQRGLCSFQVEMRN